MHNLDRFGSDGSYSGTPKSSQKPHSAATEPDLHQPATTTTRTTVLFARAKSTVVALELNRIYASQTPPSDAGHEDVAVGCVVPDIVEAESVLSVVDAEGLVPDLSTHTKKCQGVALLSPLVCCLLVD